MTSINLEGECISIEELVRAWRWFNLFRAWPLVEDRPDTQKLEGYVKVPAELYRECERRIKLQMEPDPQGL